MWEGGTSVGMSGGGMGQARPSKQLTAQVRQWKHNCGVSMATTETVIEFVCNVGMVMKVVVAWGMAIWVMPTICPLLQQGGVWGSSAVFAQHRPTDRGNRNVVGPNQRHTGTFIWSMG